MPKRIIIFLLLPLLAGCFDTELVFEDQYKAVVEAYLYVDRDISKINISSMISFGEDSTGGDKITDAQVLLGRSKEEWRYAHDDAIPGTYYLDECPVLVPGDTFRLMVELDDAVLTAETVIPETPATVAMSSSTVYIPKVADMREFRSIEMPDPVELTWNNPGADYYFFNIQNIESYPLPIMPDPPVNSPFAHGGFVFQMVTRPTNNNFYSISVRELTHFGTHRIVVTRVNEEYVYLYNSQDQDTRELNEPYTNIENGLGIFTAFNSDTLYLEVVPVYK